jgi:hypothetical protein
LLSSGCYAKFAEVKKRMKTLKLGIMLLAFLLAAMVMVPMVNAEEFSTHVKEELNNIYASDNVIASFGQVSAKNNEIASSEQTSTTDSNFVDIEKMDSDPWYTILNEINNESYKELHQKYWSPSGPIIGQGTDLKGSIVVFINKNWAINKSDINFIYQAISEKGLKYNVKNIPCRFISISPLETQAREDKIRPVFGGLKVHSNGEAGTLGFIARDNSGNLGIVTTGHLSNAGSQMYQPDPSISNSLLGNIISVGNTNSDSSWTRYSSTVPEIYENTGIYSTVKHWANGPTGRYLYMSGVSSGVTIGLPSYSTQIHSDYFNKDIPGQWLAKYSSAGGDSGAPVYEKNTQHEITLVGIHVGRLGSGSTGYAVFSPISGVRQDLGVTPVTG